MNSAGGKEDRLFKIELHQRQRHYIINHLKQQRIQDSYFSVISLITSERMTGHTLSDQHAHSHMQGLTWGKHALVRSPSNAKELCLTSGIVS